MCTLTTLNLHCPYLPVPADAAWFLVCKMSAQEYSAEKKQVDGVTSALRTQ